MNGAFLSLDDLVILAAETLLHFLWQGTIVAFLTCLAARLARRRSADARYRVYLTGLVAMVICPAATFAWLSLNHDSDHSSAESHIVRNTEIAGANALGERPNLPPADAGNAGTPPMARESVRRTIREGGGAAKNPSGPVAADRGDATAGAASPSGSFVWPPNDQATRYAVLLYAFGAAGMIFRLLLAGVGVRRLRRRAEPPGEELQALFNAAAGRLRLHHRPALAVCRELAGPVANGVLRPIVLLPASIISSLPPNEIEIVMLHELAHLRRLDHLILPLQRLIEALLFFHPGVWVVSRRLSAERENCCDDAVVRAGTDRIEYVSLLLRLAERQLSGAARLPCAAMLSAADERPSRLRQRVARLLAVEGEQQMTVSRPALVLALAAAGLLMLAPAALKSLATAAPADTAEEEAEPGRAGSRLEVPSADDLAAIGAGDWPQFGGTSHRNNARLRGSYSADLKLPEQLRWKFELPQQSPAGVAVADGLVFVPATPGIRSKGWPEDGRPALCYCLDEDTGELLWTYRPAERIERTIEWWLNGYGNVPLVEGDRAYFVSAAGQVVCLDTHGFSDRRNDGPYRGERATGRGDADVVWIMDLRTELGVRLKYVANSAVTSAGSLLLLSTSQSHHGDEKAAVKAPSFLALDKKSGRVVWSDASPGENILDQTWGAPACGVLGGVPQAIFPGGDGWLYSFDIRAMQQGKTRLLWKFDCNEKTSRWILGARGDRNSIPSAPVIHEGLVYVATGQDPEHGEGAGRIWCIDPSRRGDVSSHAVFTMDDGKPVPHRRLQAAIPDNGEVVWENANSALVWKYDEFDADSNGKLEFEEKMHRSFGSVAIAEGLLVAVDYSGLVHCLDAKTGRPNWSHDLLATSWGTPLIAGGHIYVADEDGDVTVLRLAREKAIVAEISLKEPVYATPVAAGGAIYLTTPETVLAIEGESKAAPAPLDAGGSGRPNKPLPPSQE